MTAKIKATSSVPKQIVYRWIRTRYALYDRYRYKPPFGNYTTYRLDYVDLSGNCIRIALHNDKIHVWPPRESGALEDSIAIYYTDPELYSKLSAALQP